MFPQLSALLRFRLRFGTLALLLTLHIVLSLYGRSRLGWPPSVVLLLDLLTGLGLFWLRHLWLGARSPYTGHLKVASLLALFALTLIHNYNRVSLGYALNDLFFIPVMVAAFDFGVWGGLVVSLGSLTAVLAFSLADGMYIANGSLPAVAVQHLILYVGISLVTGRLVSELALDRERYRVIVEDSQHPIVTVDRKSRVTLFNSAAQELSGLKEEPVLNRTEQQDKSGKNGWNYTSMPCRALELQAEERGILQKATINGHTRYFLVDTYLVYSPLGQVSGAFAIHKDITELKAKEAELEAVNEKLEQLTLLDPLTQLDNRRSFDLDLSRELARSHRSQRPLSLVALDLDHFKQINDAHGHSVGDLVLQECARSLQECVRESDNLYRYGGEEFVIILPETTMAEAAQVAERVRQAVAALEVGGGSDRITLTVSLGIATELGDEHTTRTLFEAADQALYQAKQSGRNQVRQAG